MKRIRKKILIATLAFLSASAAHSDQILNNLLESSQSIVDSLHAGYQVAGGLAAMAHTGTGVAQMGVVAESGALITGDQVSAYNNAVQAMAEAEYYTAQNFFLDESEKALERMETAIENFSEAATELVITTQVAERSIKKRSMNTTVRWKTSRWNPARLPSGPQQQTQSPQWLGRMKSRKPVKRVLPMSVRATSVDRAVSLPSIGTTWLSRSRLKTSESGPIQPTYC